MEELNLNNLITRSVPKEYDQGTKHIEHDHEKGMKIHLP
jgi:hypothetical protein